MSSNRWLQERLVRSNSLTAVAAGLLSVLLTFLVMHLWRFDLAVPVVYWIDALYVNVLVKALTEGTWNYHIARLGAPFGLDAVDFPDGCTLDFAVIKILTAIIRNPFLSSNLYWLIYRDGWRIRCSFFRSLQISHLPAPRSGRSSQLLPMFFSGISLICIRCSLLFRRLRTWR